VVVRNPSFSITAVILHPGKEPREAEIVTVKLQKRGIQEMPWDRDEYDCRP
jgi:hypothetical protein